MASYLRPRFKLKCQIRNGETGMGDLFHWEEGKRAKDLGLSSSVMWGKYSTFKRKRNIQMSPQVSMLGQDPCLPVGENPTDVKFSLSIYYQIRKFLFQKGPGGKELANWNKSTHSEMPNLECICVYAHMFVDQGNWTKNLLRESWGSEKCPSPTPTVLMHHPVERSTVPLS